MESDQSSNYEVERNFIWKNTIDDGDNKFYNVNCKIIEQTTGAKIKEIEYSDTKSLSNFLRKEPNMFIEGLLVYDFELKKIYKISEVKHDAEDNVSSMNLTQLNCNENRKVENLAELNNFRDYLILHLVISQENKEKVVVEVKQKFKESFEIGIKQTLKCFGINNVDSSLFYKGKILDKSMRIENIEDIKEGDIIFVTEMMGKVCIFKRFKEVCMEWHWSNSGEPDSIIFIPNKNIKICGFTCYAAVEKNSYEMRYTVRIDNLKVEEETITCSNWEDIYYNRVKLKSSYDVSANSKICLDCCIAESLQSNECIETYHGENGDEYDNVENEHMGLFKIEDSENDQNGTGLYSGQFCEILYKLI